MSFLIGLFVLELLNMFWSSADEGYNPRTPRTRVTTRFVLPMQ